MRGLLELHEGARRHCAEQELVVQRNEHEAKNALWVIVRTEITNNSFDQNTCDQTTMSVQVRW